MQGLNPQKLHHTYIISGDRRKLSEDLFSFLEKDLKIKTKGNPDFFFKEYDTFLVEDARNVNSFQQNQTLGNHQVLILSVSEITPQAQNAFLKITEDPSKGTTFFFLVPNLEIILPTLRSRAEVIEYKSSIDDSKEMARKFLRSNPSQRMDIVSELHPKDKDLVDIEKVEGFLSGLESELKEKEYLHDIYETKKRIRSKGVSIKVLLEHLAGILPF